MKTDGMHTNGNGTKHWFLNGEYHRTDGPAIEFVNGNKYWYLNGEYHREDGPAIELFTNGNKAWYLNGKQVRMEDVITDPTEQFWWKLKS